VAVSDSKVNDLPPREAEYLAAINYNNYNLYDRSRRRLNWVDFAHHRCASSRAHASYSTYPPDGCYTRGCRRAPNARAAWMRAAAGFRENRQNRQKNL